MCNILEKGDPGKHWNVLDFLQFIVTMIKPLEFMSVFYFTA
jgi:hypothetical protein